MKLPIAEAPCLPSLIAMSHSPLSALTVASIVVLTICRAKLLNDPEAPSSSFLTLLPAAARLPRPWIVIAMLSLIGADCIAVRNLITSGVSFESPCADWSAFCPALANLAIAETNAVTESSTPPDDWNVVTMFCNSGVSCFMPSAVCDVASPALASLATAETKLLRSLLTLPRLPKSLTESTMSLNGPVPNLDMSVPASLRSEFVNFVTPESLKLVLPIFVAESAICLKLSTPVMLRSMLTFLLLMFLRSILDSSLRLSTARVVVALPIPESAELSPLSAEVAPLRPLAEPAALSRAEARSPNC